MSEILTLKTQKELKPKIDDVLPYFFENDELETALNFIAYLRANKLNPRWSGVHNTWSSSCKGKVICFIRLGAIWHAEKKVDKIKWEIAPNLINIDSYENKIIENNIQNYIWDGLAYCQSCVNSDGMMRGCSPGINKTVLKKDITSICGGFYNGRKPISFQNPDETVINHIKKLLEWEKHARTGSN